MLNRCLEVTSKEHKNQRNKIAELEQKNTMLIRRLNKTTNNCFGSEINWKNDEEWFFSFLALFLLYQYILSWIFLNGIEIIMQEFIFIWFLIQYLHFQYLYQIFSLRFFLFVFISNSIIKYKLHNMKCTNLLMWN